MKKILGYSIIVAIFIVIFSGLNFKSNAASVNATDITLYAMTSSYNKYISIPQNLPQEFQIVVTGATNVTYKVISGDISVSDTGLVTPKTTIMYYAGGYYTNDPAYSIDDSKAYTKISFGDAVIRVTAGSQTFDINVHVLDYVPVYAEQVMDEFIKENINSSMSDMEKAGIIMKYVLNTYDYKTGVSSAASMIVIGGGDCWANSDLVVALGLKAGINVWTRDAYRDIGAGSGHVNVMFEDDGKYYIIEAGTTGEAPRDGGYIIPKSSLFSYELKNGKAYIYQYDGKSSDKTITVPSKIDGYEVAGIESKAFERLKTEEVILPSTITSIESLTFNECANLKKVVIPEGVTKIGESAFEECTSLDEITLPSTLQTIEKNAFYRCSSLETINIPSSVTTIGDTVFTECSSMKSITCDSNNKNYSSEAGVLYNKNKTELIAIPYDITSLKIANTIETIPTRICFENTNIKELVIPESVKIIEEHAFYGCTGIESIIFEGAGLERIERGAFWNCTSVKNDIVFPSTLKFIGDHAFCQAYELKSITIPGSVKEIGADAFVSCKKLEEVNILGEGLETIGDNAFRSCEALKGELIIPASVKYIGRYAFSIIGRNLDKIIFYTDLPEIDPEAFYSLKDLSKIYYRKGTTGFNESNTEYTANFEKTNYSIKPNSTQEMNLQFLCDKVKNYVSSITYTSDNTNVAYFSNGSVNKLTTKNEGSAQITANITYKDGTKEQVVTKVQVSKAKKGDVNKDGKVTLYDALQILKQSILGGNLSDEMLYIMDYNDDGKVKLYDALKFLQQAILE